MNDEEMKLSRSGTQLKLLSAEDEECRERKQQRPAVAMRKLSDMDGIEMGEMSRYHSRPVVCLQIHLHRTTTPSQNPRYPDIISSSESGVRKDAVMALAMLRARLSRPVRLKGLEGMLGWNARTCVSSI